MGRIRFLISRMMRMDHKAMFRTARMLHGKTGKSTAWLLRDMISCAAHYGAGYMDYKIAEMYNLNAEQRATVITRSVSNSIVARMNDKAYWHYFDDKPEFNTLFAGQVKRGWLDVRTATDEQLRAFLAGKGDLIGKPADGSSGRGVAKYRADEIKDVEWLRSQEVGILEECIVQHPEMNRLCPTSVNTIRIATLLGDKKQGIVYAYLRIGNGKVMDNVDQGGMAAPIDPETGTLRTVGADKQGNRYERHPMTGTVIPGFRIPYWEEAKAMCMEASRVIPQVRFVAWDVAITPTGPVFVEGNSFPSHAIPQFAAHYPDGIGILPRFKEFIDL